MAYAALIVGTVMILAAARLRVNIGLAAAVAGLTVAGLSGDGFGTVIAAIREMAFEPQGISLLLAIAFITTLGSTMKVSGAMEGLVRSVRPLFRDSRVVAALLPSLIGLLSVPGSAMFSAPLVDSVGSDIGMSREQKAVANVLFRHLWYYVYPIHTAFILLQQTSGMPYSALFLPGLTCAVLTLAIAARVAFSGATKAHTGGTLPSARSRNTESPWKAACSFVTAAAPLIVVLVFGLGMRMDFSIAAGLGVVTAVMLVPPGRSYVDEVARRFREGVVGGVDWLTVGTVAGTVFFSRVVINSSALEALGAGTSSGASSLLVFALAVPFAVGFVTGSHIAAVGITLPLLLPLLDGHANAYGFLTLSYIVSLAGYVVSPAHVCLVGTVQCLKSDFARTWRMAWAPTVAVLLLAAALGFWWAL